MNITDATIAMHLAHRAQERMYEQGYPVQDRTPGVPRRKPRGIARLFATVRRRKPIAHGA